MRVPVHPLVSERVVRMTAELWVPGQITHRLQSGLIDGPLVRSYPRFRGTIEFGVRSAVQAGNDEALAQLDLFLTSMGQVGAWCNMPWGGADLPRFRIPKPHRAADTVDPMTGEVTPGAVTPYWSVVSAVATASAGFQVEGRGGLGTGLRVGDWIGAHSGLIGVLNVLQKAIVSEAGAATAKPASIDGNEGTGADQVGLRTVPDLQLGVGANVYAGTHMRMRFPSEGDATVGISRTGSWGGPWVLPWEEYLGAN